MDNIETIASVADKLTTTVVLLLALRLMSQAQGEQRRHGNELTDKMLDIIEKVIDRIMVHTRTKE